VTTGTKYAPALGLGGIVISSPDQIADRVIQPQHLDPKLLGIQDSGDIRLFTDASGNADFQWIFPVPYPTGEIPFVVAMRIGVTGTEANYPTFGIGINEILANIRVRGDAVVSGTIFIRAMAFPAGSH